MIYRAFGCFAAVAAVVALSAACGGSQPPPAEPTNPAPSSEAAPSASAATAPTDSAPPAASSAPAATTAEAPPGPPPAPGPGEWDGWSHEKKGEYMKTVFAPKLGGLFHDFDAKAFADPKCELCHGKGVKDGSFKMPNADLPKLPAPGPALMKLFDPKNPKKKVVDFMVEVEKTSAGLLGEQPYDPKTKKGFGCFECHTQKGAK